jgi:hypothetical protein
VRDLHGWNADPSGRHQERYFSDGQATPLVRDSAPESQDATSLPRMHQPSGDSSLPDSPFRSAPELCRGWHADPSGEHQFRYYELGDPTRWVSNDGRVSEDEFGSVGEEPREPATVVDTSTSLSASFDDISRAAHGWSAGPASPGGCWDGSRWIRHATVGKPASEGASTASVDPVVSWMTLLNSAAKSVIHAARQVHSDRVRPVQPIREMQPDERGPAFIAEANSQARTGG